jgi:hypothetical protein
MMKQLFSVDKSSVEPAEEPDKDIDKVINALKHREVYNKNN